jgi:chromosome segregation ATPase
VKNAVIAGSLLTVLATTSSCSTPAEKSAKKQQKIVMVAKEIKTLKATFNTTLQNYQNFIDGEYKRKSSIYISALEAYNAVADKDNANTAQKREEWKTAEENLKKQNKIKEDYEKKLDKLEKEIPEKEQKLTKLETENATYNAENEIEATEGREGVPDGLIQEARSYTFYL